MKILLSGGAVYRNGDMEPLEIAVDGGRIVSVGRGLPRDGFRVIELENRLIVPGFVDVHVHLREPGFS